MSSLEEGMWHSSLREQLNMGLNGGLALGDGCVERLHNQNQRARSGDCFNGMFHHPILVVSIDATEALPLQFQFAIG
eukprot:10036097-Ditylum_brightwellii.AAC.1